MPIRINKFLVATLILIIVASALFVVAPFLFGFDIFKTSAVDTPTRSGYAWSSNIGWIKMFGTASDGTPYGVEANPNTGQLSGYAWSSGVGWISFGDVGGGSSEAFPEAPRYSARVEGNAIKGWARAYAPVLSGGITEGGWDGWIKMSGTATNGSSYGVNIDSSGNWSGYAWGGQIFGWIDFTGAFTLGGPCSGGSICPDGQSCSINGSCPLPLKQPDSCTLAVECPTGVCGVSGFCASSDSSDLENDSQMQNNVGASLYIVPPSAVINKESNISLQANYDAGTGVGAIPVNSAPGMIWDSSDTKVATVSSGYVMAGNKTGATDITASYNGLIAIAKIVVSDPCAPRLTLSTQLINLVPGNSKKISAFYGAPVGCSKPTIDVTDQTAFLSKDNSIASVSGNTVTGVAEGNTQIDASYKNDTASAIVTVFYSSSVERECKALNPSFTWSSPPALNKIVTFVGAGSGSISSWEWNFTGALPSTQNGKEVSVKFNTSGKSRITLRVSDGSNVCTISRTLNSGGRVEQ